MEGRASDWRPGPTVCRCCLTEGCYKDISTEYFWMGKREVYAEMLSETLNVSIAFSKSGGPNSNSRLICEPCIARLRDASEFKRQVVDCEKTFMHHLDPGSSSRAREFNVETSGEVKVEVVKREKASLSDDDFDDRPDFLDVDTDDDLDDQPLTKLASKIPKKESVDLLDLLDSSQITVKRKSNLKLKEAPPKKIIKKKEVVKPSVSKTTPVKQAEKKKENKAPLSSIWQLTNAERNNAATFIQHTTVRPFIFMGSSFKCFFCLQYYSEIPALLEHTATHTTENEASILNKYLHKGKRTLQADISKLNCRICNVKFSNLDTIKEHLQAAHAICFFTVSNGITEYNLKLKNKMFVCQLCNKSFHNFSLLNKHMNCHVGKVICEKCGDRFLNQHLLMKHYKESHLYKHFSCKLCDRYFTKRSQLKYHTQIHKGKQRTNLNKCPECLKTFKQHYGKMLHLKEAHGVTKSFECHLCELKFSMRRSLTEHVSKDHTEKHKCEVCSKCYSTEFRLKQHIRGHTSEKNFICPICKNSYMHQMTLRKHMQSHDSTIESSP